jgi:hypothetical protein
MPSENRLSGTPSIEINKLHEAARVDRRRFDAREARRTDFLAIDSPPQRAILPPDVALHQSMIPRIHAPWYTAALGAWLCTAVWAGEEAYLCLPSGGGGLELEISGDFEASVAWGNEGTRCEGGPRPAGDALRLMFSRDDDGLLMVLGITGLERGATGTALLANITIVRQGKGLFYGSLGADSCVVEVDENSPDVGLADTWLVRGRGRCEAPIEAIAREGEIRVAPFTFTGKAYWPDEED